MTTNPFKEDTSGAEAFAAFLLLPVSVIFTGFTLAKLWGWHVVPVFHLAPLSLGSAIGLNTFYNFMRANLSAPRREVGPLQSSFEAMLYNAIALFVGWAAT